LIPTIGGHTLSQIVSRRAHPIWVSLMSPGETLMSLLIGFLFLGQNLGIHELLGGTLILAGAGCAIAGEKKA
jgi:drug/metabolite transporter (DMT)-like permease